MTNYLPGMLPYSQSYATLAYYYNKYEKFICYYRKDPGLFSLTTRSPGMSRIINPLSARTNITKKNSRLYVITVRKKKQQCSDCDASDDDVIYIGEAHWHDQQFRRLEKYNQAEGHNKPEGPGSLLTQTTIGLKQPRTNFNEGHLH